MTESLTHERCSELLLPYLQEGLDGARAAAVRAHLEGCDDCTDELDALRSLQSAPALALTEMESHRLRRAVLEEVGPPVAASSPVRARSGWAAYAGVAAVLVLLLAGGAWLFTGGMTGSDQGQNALSGDAAEGGDGPLRDSDEAPVAEEGGGGGSTRLSNDAARKLSPRPTFAPYQGRVDDRALKQIGRSRLFASIAKETTFAAASKRETSLLAALADQAPEDLAADVEACGRRTQQLASGPALPAYATTALILGRDVLVLGFAAADSSGGVLDRFLFVAWARGACEEIVDSVDGAIGK